MEGKSDLAELSNVYTQKITELFEENANLQMQIDEIKKKPDQGKEIEKLKKEIENLKQSEIDIHSIKCLDRRYIRGKAA